MNVPYAKQYDANGLLLNPITSIKNEFPNRKQRREKPKRFMSNKKGCQMVVGKNYRYIKHVQVIEKENGETVRIPHYILK